MMKRVALVLALLCAPTLAHGQQRVTIQNGTAPVSNSNPLPVSASITPSGTQNVNLTQILGAAPSLTNYLWVFPATGATFPVSGTVTANIGTNPTQAPVAPATATATKSTLLGAQATTAAVNPTNGQQSALSSDTNNNLLTSPGGAPNFATSQVTVTTGSTAVCAARALRRSCTITQITGTQQVYCSGTTATTGNGQLIPAVVGASFNVSTTAAVNCIAVSSSQTVSVAETY